MRIVNQMALLSTGILLSSAAYADDDTTVEGNDAPRPLVTLSAETLLEESRYVSHWEQLQPDTVSAYSENWSRSISDVDFKDASVLARVSRLRNLSLLTLAEIGDSRLFLGVNDDGLVGLHFRAYPRFGDDSYLEVVRMPYLKEEEPNNSVDP